MKLKIALVFLFLGLNSIAQIKFEKGYIIKNNGEKVECLIKNEDWLYTPNKFKYKIDKNSKEIEGNLFSIKEFCVKDKFKYVKFKVKIDKFNSKKLSNTREFNFESKKLFLQVLIQSKVSLYVYNTSSSTKYFYKKENSPVEQLQYKQYLNSKNSIVTNKNYLTQLRLNLACKKIEQKKVNYKKLSLVKYITEYNNCKGNEIIEDYSKKKSRKAFLIKGKIGVNNSKSKIFQTPGFNNNQTFFDTKTNINFGVEFEFILPFNKNKWSIFFEPNYRTFSGQKKLIDSYDKSRPGIIYKDTELEYNSIEINLGLRHYFYFNKKNSLFINSAIVSDLPVYSSVFAENKRDANFKIEKTEINLMFGIGIFLNSKITLEARYFTNRDILATYSGWDSEFNSFSFLIGYSLL